MAVAPAEQAARAPLSKLVGGHKAGGTTTVRDLVHHLQTNWPTALTARTCSHQEAARFVEKCVVAPREKRTKFNETAAGKSQSPGISSISEYSSSSDDEQ